MNLTNEQKWKFELRGLKITHVNNEIVVESIHDTNKYYQNPKNYGITF